MPALELSAVLDTAIGLAFIFFLLSLVSASINEMIATAFNWRSKNLVLALKGFFGEDETDDEPSKTDEFLDSPRVKALGKPKTFFPSRRPSYIPPRAFAETVLEIVFPAGNGTGDPIQATRETINEIQNEPVKEFLLSRLRHGEATIEQFGDSLEESFDQLMDRASGWYKRKVQIILLLVSVVIAGGLNADAFIITQHLFTNDTVRTAVLAEAQQAVEDEGQDTPSGDSQPDEADNLQQAAQRVTEVEQLNLPLGWRSPNTPESVSAWLFKIGGIALTAIAISLGAPFWFDLLGRFARLRGVGNREGTSKSDGRMAVDRDDRS